MSFFGYATWSTELFEQYLLNVEREAPDENGESASQSIGGFPPTAVLSIQDHAMAVLSDRIRLSDWRQFRAVPPWKPSWYVACIDVRPRAVHLLWTYLEGDARIHIFVSTN